MRVRRGLRSALGAALLAVVMLGSATPAQAAVQSVQAPAPTAGTATGEVNDAFPVTPVSSVDVPRYMGQWYQIAAIPTAFEAQCAKNVTARYRLLDDGTIRVRNACRTDTGELSAVTGRARSDNPPANSVLSVTFANVAGEWLYPADPNYYIIGLDRHYEWAVVGLPTRTSGFVLSRKPVLTARQAVAAAAVLISNGYDPCDFRITRQDGGAAGSDLC